MSTHKIVLNFATTSQRNALLMLSLLTISSVSPVLSAQDSNGKQFLDIKLTHREIADEASGNMRLDASETAEILKIRAMVDRLRVERKAHAGDSSNLSKPMQQARLLCLYKILVASEEIRKAKADLDFELAKSNENVDLLTAKLNQAINLINTCNFAQGGTLGTVKQSLSLKHHSSPAARQEIAMVSFGTGAVLSVVDLLLPSIYRKKITDPPNSLAYIFDDTRVPGDADRSYLWRFLNAPSPDAGLTRRQLLVKHWQAFARVNPNDEQKVKKLSNTPTGTETLHEDIKLLHQRISVLQDLKTHIEEFDGCLYELHDQITFAGPST